MARTHLEYLEEILNSKNASDYLTGYQIMTIDALAELLSFCPYERLCELAQADQEGRCVILPVKPGDSVRFAKNPRAKNETVDAITIYSDGRMSFGFHEYGVKTEWVDRWSEDDACKYVLVESTEAALRGEQE